MELNDKSPDPLSQSETDILTYIQNHATEVCRMNIQELADRVFVSTSAIVRLCKKLQLSGFNDLKYGIRQSLHSSKSVMDTSLDFKGILSTHLSGLRHMIQQINPEQFEQVIDLLCGDGNMFLFARGLTYMPISYMYNMLLSVDRECILYIDPPLMYNAALQMEQGDMAFIASSQGATKEVIKAAHMVKDSLASLVILSSSQNTVLEELADIFLLCPASNRRFGEVDINSRFSIAFMIELILEGYFNRLNLNPPSDPKVYVDLKNW